MKRFILFVLVLGLFLSCNEERFSTLVVTGQVAKTLGPESNTASVLLGKATVENLFHDEWMETPDPGDTTFWNDVFPARITPIANADVQVNSETIGQKLPGIYFKPAIELNYLDRYDLEIETPDGKLITANGFLPDSFAITNPHQGDTLSPDSVIAIWTLSDSSEVFLVGITPADSASSARSWAGSFQDTCCSVPGSVFQDTLGAFVPGEYILTVTAVNGGWNKSGLDLFLSGGNLDGALGTFGCAVLPKPVVFQVR